MSKQDQAQIYQMLSVLFLTASKGEQALQSIRQVLTAHPFFSPLPLFRYISRNNPTIRKQHLMIFLQENKEQATQEEIKGIIQFCPGRKAWQYRDFLEFVYPFNSAVLRQISNYHLKRYPTLQKYSVHEITVASFVILLTQQLALVRKMQVQKGDSFKKVPKDRLRRVLLTIKRAGEREASHCPNDDTVITSLQLRNFMKAFVSVQQSHFYYLSRRLGIIKGSLPIEQLQKFIKPMKKVRQTVTKSQKKIQKATIQQSPDDFTAQQHRQFNQDQYRDGIYQQLANTISAKPNSKNQKRNVIRQPQFQPRKRSDSQGQPRKPIQNHIDLDPGSNRKSQRDRKKRSPQELLLEFIQIYLPSAQALQALKLKVAQHKLDYLSLFKKIDSNSRGVVSGQDLYAYYLNSGGTLPFSEQQFELLIDRYAQSDQPWISLSQFCEMVRAQEKDGVIRSPAKLGQDPEQLVIRIMQLSLKSQLSILKIRQQFGKKDSKKLFDMINRQQTGTITYQQLKRFLSQAGLRLSMHDVMSVLKRLDRSRNGVVLENEFVDYFRPISSQ